MPQAYIERQDIFEDAGSTFMSQVYGNTGALITIASITSITCKVFNLDAADPTVVVLQPSVVVATSVFDTLQLDGMWAKDALGYNFRFTVPKAAFTSGGRHRVEFLFDPASGEDFFVVYEPKVLAVYSS